MHNSKQIFLNLGPMYIQYLLLLSVNKFTLSNVEYWLNISLNDFHA